VWFKRHATMRIRKAPYLLIVLIFWAQLDDLLPSPSASAQSAPLAGDDEYPPVKVEKASQGASGLLKPLLAGSKSGTIDFDSFFAKRDSLTVLNSLASPDPSHLYDFMSLQL
jgi:hypothetical protein